MHGGSRFLRRFTQSLHRRWWHVLPLCVLLIVCGAVDARAMDATPVRQADDAAEQEPLPEAEPLRVDPRHREDARLFFQRYYEGADAVPIDWSGDRAACRPGATADAYRAATLQRINYYRAMAGLAPVTFTDEYNRLAQQAALMTSINGLSHNPSPSARCYTAAGARAAANAHLYVGRHGPAAIDGYIKDHDEPINNNYHVGHRRWILLPQLRVMGSGDVPAGEDAPAANALWVVDPSIKEERPPTRDRFVAWPPPGYVPYQVVYPRWSFSYPAADFSQAQVSMQRGDERVEVVIEPLYAWEPTEPTLVWIPEGMESQASWPRPEHDVTYTVTIGNVGVDGRWLTFSYDVIVFDPDAEPVPSTSPITSLPFGLPLPLSDTFGPH